jgi:cation transport regulator ChaB
MSMPDESAPYGSVPVPDPTELTSRAVDALDKKLTALFNTKLEGELQVLEQRLEGIDKATELARTNLPQTVNDQVTHLKELILVMFESVQTQFKERDVRADRESTANTVKVDAAFAAAKEAAAATLATILAAISEIKDTNEKSVGKLEANILQLVKGLADKIEDVKTSTTENRQQINSVIDKQVGGRERTTETRSTITFAQGLIAAAIAGILGLAAIFALSRSDTPPDPVVVEVPAAETP